MIFDYEVDAVVNGSLGQSERDTAIEHYSLGGFHPNVSDSQRRAFKLAIAAHPQKQTTPTPVTVGRQLDLLQ